MYGKSLIDDVKRPSQRSEYGWPILFPNADIRKMLQLANVGKNDIFYDLGSGWGQNVLVALTEFRVKRAVGIEINRGRWTKSNSRLNRWKSHYAPLRLDGHFINADYYDLFSEKVDSSDLQGASLEEATVVFYGLSTDRLLADSFSRFLPDGCRLLYYSGGLFPEFVPERASFPFFMSKKPFRKPKNAIQWLESVTGKVHSSYRGGPEASEDELWDELAHDQGWDYDRRLLEDYRKRAIVQRRESYNISCRQRNLIPLTSQSSRK